MSKKAHHWATRLKLRLGELGQEAFILKGERDVARMERDEARSVARKAVWLSNEPDRSKRQAAALRLAFDIPWMRDKPLELCPCDPNDPDWARMTELTIGNAPIGESEAAELDAIWARLSARNEADIAEILGQPD